jgi:PPOX class probable F420-dependent enzyme
VRVLAAPGGGPPSGIACSVQLIELVAQASSPCMTAAIRAAAAHWLATFCDRFGRREAQAPAPVWYEAVMWVAMGAAGREEFLAGVRVGVLSAAIGTVGQTLAVPVWYSYPPGGLVTVLTGRRSRKAAAIRAAGRFGVCVQDASPPYRYVSVEGPVVSEEEPDPAERLAMARRYLGAAGGDRYVAGNPDPGRENVAFRMRPQHWLSQDQGKG